MREGTLGRLALGERRRGGGNERRILQRRPIQPVELPQTGQIQQPRHLDGIRRIHIELADQQGEDPLGSGVGDLQPHRRAEPAAGEFSFQRLQQILVTVLLDLEVRVTGDPEDLVLDDLHAREELRLMRGDQVLDRQEVVRAAAHSDEAVDVAGHLQPRESLGAGLRVTHDDRHVQAEPGDVRERMPRVDGQGSEHREDVVAEVRGQSPLVRLVDLVPVHQPDPVVLQRGQHIAGEAMPQPLHQFLGAHRDPFQLLGDRHPVRARHPQTHLRPAFEPGDAHHVELVEVGGEDRQELHPLEQRLVGVLGEFEHPGVEVQPGQFPVQEPIGRQWRRRGLVGDGLLRRSALGAGRNRRGRRRIHGAVGILPAGMERFDDLAGPALTGGHALHCGV